MSVQRGDHLYDLTVIGGGPVGMFATFYAATRNLDVQLVESLPTLGGQVSALYPEKRIFDVAGFVNGTGKQLIGNLRQQLDMYRETVTIRAGEEVVGLSRTTHDDPDGGDFTLTTTKRVSRSRAVLIAMGSGAFTPRRLAVQYDHHLDDAKVLYTVRHLHDFDGKVVALAGGGNAAIDWALTLEPLARQVTLIHRRNNFRALEANVERLKSSSVHILTPYRFVSVADASSGVDIALRRVKGADTCRVHADVLLVNYGFVSDNHLLGEWGLPVSRGDLPVDKFMQTAMPGVYGVGDAVTYPGKVKLISSGFGETPTVINHIAETLYPERKQPLHS